LNQLQPTGERGGMGAVLVACCAVGAITVGATLTLGHGSFNLNRAAPGPAGMPTIATEEYGKRLLAQTSELLGPDAPDPKMRYAGSRMSCGSCHLGTGIEPGTLTLLSANEHYPRFSARVGATTTIEDRVNECMQRSLNGRPLPRNSPEMIAMASYIRALGAREAAMGASQLKATEPASFKVPGRAADLDAGRKVF
jgi:thiosulfate dehydrogenase